MSVLRRDNRRCRICGRRPDDHVDVELHVHHIRPWAKGGLTEITNLITLCHTCHKGLEPHEDPTLYQYVDQRFKSVDANKELEAFLAGVARYRSRMYAMVVPSERPEE
jgi:5-methylcytosine-specific restriction endonuclease McrA